MKPPRAQKRIGKASSPKADFLAGLLDNTNLAAYLKDVEGRYLYTNRRFERLTGVPRDVMLGKRDHDYFHPEVADLFRSQDAEVAKRRTLVEFEETIALPGGVLSFITEKFPLFDKKGKVYAVGGFCTEITSQKDRADESLAEERERLAVTLNSVASGIVATDAKGAVILLNPAAEKIAGMSQADAAGRSVDEVLLAAEPASEGILGRLVKKALTPAGDLSSFQDVALISADGAKRTVVPAAGTVRDHGGNITGAVLCLRDVTEQRQADAELFKIRSLESLGFLAGGIAHDFNNLLTGIMGNLELLGQEAVLSGPAREMLDDAGKICAKASTLSRQLLTFADGGIPVRKTFAPGPMLGETAHLILHGSPVKSRVTAPGDLWPIEGDDAQFTQVLGNLLINAREAMPDGGTVWIRGENHSLAEPMLHLPAGRYVRLTVRDDGPGIAAATLTRIFNPFFSSKERGSGLGLAIVHSVVRRHGGHIWAESTEGKGTLFTILLPASGKAAPKRAAPGRTALKTGKGRVLVMDDEAVVGDIARKILGRAGYAVSVEREGAAAVAAYRAALAAGERFDAAILDLTVPGGMGGMEAAAEMLVLDPKASIILSSGYSKDDPGYSAFAAGRVFFLAKPYTIEQLTSMVAKVVRG